MTMVILFKSVLDLAEDTQRLKRVCFVSRFEACVQFRS